MALPFHSIQEDIMKTVTAYLSDDGQLHDTALRCAAANLHHSLPRRDTSASEKILSFSDCLRILDNRNLVKGAIADFEKEMIRSD